MDGSVAGQPLRRAKSSSCRALSNVCALLFHLPRHACRLTLAMPLVVLLAQKVLEA